jgi:hypothetical protein
MFFTCPNTLDRISLRRVNDGYVDCLYAEDEKNSAYITMTEPYRYRCQSGSSPVQYVSFQQLGNGINECTDSSDEISRETSWSYLDCRIDDSYACWVLQGDGITDNRIKDVRLPFHLYCDTIWDTLGGRDECNCSKWICARGTYQCNRTDQCIKRTYLCDGEFDCDDGEDELNCPERRQQWPLEFICNTSNEHFCITSRYPQDRILHHPCISYTHVGDRKIDCLGGQDERNVFSCSDHTMVGNRFLCDNQTRCLNYTTVCNGIFDCFDRTDEDICFWQYEQCTEGQLNCSNGNLCEHGRCHSNSNYTCSNETSWFWCPNAKTISTIYRSSKRRRPSNYETFCSSHLTSPVTTTATKTSLSILDTARNGRLRPYGLCDRGFYLTDESRQTYYCFCPPSFYGNRCQLNRRRITVRVRFDRRHRLDLPAILHVLVLLVYNDETILDHQMFVDIDKDFPSKHTIYLLYPRPRPHGLYTVRLEAYHSTNTIMAWEYPISPLSFLPVFRLTKILRFPDRSLPWLCLSNYCQNNGTCYNIDNGQYLCSCTRSWHGSLCEKKIDDVQCALHSLARARNVCVCPYGYLVPHCSVRNTVCEKFRPCSLNEICYGLSTQPPNSYKCLCNSSNCDTQTTAVIVMYKSQSNEWPFLLQLLKMFSSYPRLRQQILVRASTYFPITRMMKTHDTHYRTADIPEIGLMFTYQPRRKSVDISIHLLYINCSNVQRNYTINLDIPPQPCQLLNETEHHSVKHFHSFCRPPTNYSCFLSESYLCYCSMITPNRSECTSYVRRNLACAYCLNQGHCIQGEFHNKSDFVCVCPTCVSGKLCQYTPSRFLVSLEYLMVKAKWHHYHYIGPMIFLFFGTVFNGLSMITFVKPKCRQTSSGFYLLVNACTSELVLVLLCSRVAYLHLSRLIIIGQSLNLALCKSLPYLMSSFNYINLWLMASVTVDRALLVTFPTRFSTFSSPKLACIFTVIITAVVFGSIYIHVDQHKLVSDPNELYSWCVSEIGMSQGKLASYISLAHQIVPFIINLLSGLIIIVFISRSKAISQHLPVRRTLAKQVRER